ncbi:uncharacterized protein METZ01_LOCUS218835, partial [marine metagenome]
DFSHVDISCTTSIYQMLDIYDVFESFIELDCWFDASIVQTPKYLDPSLILLEYKKETYKDIEKTYELLQKNKKTRFNNYQHKDGLSAKYWLDYIVNYVKNFKPKYREYNRWLIYRKKSDKIWDQNFNDYFQNYQIEDNELIRVK